MKFLTLLVVVLMVDPAMALFDKADHCVAWKTRKTMGMFKTVIPVGKNCAIETKFVKTEEGLFRFEGAFPINRFDSGEKDRDAEVITILNGKKQMTILFQSQALDQGGWQKLIALGGGTISGNMKIGGQDFPIKPKIEVARDGKAFVFKGQLVTDFNSFKIKPPKIALGLVAKVHDYLELHFQFQAKEIEGLKKLFAQ